MGSESQKISRGKRKAMSDPAGPGTVRAVLPCCGRIDNASDLKHRVQEQLDTGSCAFACPHCASQWLWPEVRKLALFSEEERLRSEDRILELNKGDTEHYQRCPGCSQLCQHPPGSPSARVACGPCSLRLRRLFCFCWGCQREWGEAGGSGGSSCARPGCALRTQLLSCQLIDAPQSAVHGCPLFRACPDCHTLVSHTLLGCPNVECPNVECRASFCFRCLGKEGEHDYPECIRVEDDDGEECEAGGDEECEEDYDDDDDDDYDDYSGDNCLIKGRQRLFEEGEAS
ncbi:uncharacterized protein LOC131731614 isoform X1 [Acipenser ruthenus]|uniref:uncharacterized protein LOC131731614 isoform X1 n=1 Tax=Acipenser ruthenus TaxID=7906 RepID=UPI0027414F23|nr:uncharacterized protein LOC131731614 isoform X1 [Acipenser ruthenus]